MYAVGGKKVGKYQVRMLRKGSKQFFYIQDSETLDLILLPTKYLKYKTECGCSPKTIRRNALSLCYYLGYIQEKGMDVTAVVELPFEEQNQHFLEFLRWVKDGKHLTEERKKVTGNGTCNAYLKDVFRFFLYLANCGIAKPLCVLSYAQISVANSVGVKRTIRSQAFQGYLKTAERKVHIAQEDEIRTVLHACTNTRDRLLLLLLGETGFRIGELLGVNYVQDIDYQMHTIRVYFREDNENNARAKNAEYRRSKISEETFAFLLHYLAEYRELIQHQTYLFININGKNAGSPLKVESVYDMLKRMEAKTHIKLTPHMLRRYFAMSRWEDGWPLEMVSQALGHKHLDTTTKYLGLFDDRLMEASRNFYDRHSDIYGIKDLL